MKTVLVDLDGVVCDLVAGVLKYFGCKLPDTRGDEAYDLDKTLGYKFGRKEFWRHFDHDFWANLPLTKEADAIVELAWKFAGKDNVAFSTHPAGYASTFGKMAWLARHYPTVPVLMHCGAEPRKELVAHPGMILIDDYTKNVVEFRRAGGNAFLIARAWNHDWTLEEDNLPRLAAYLESMSPLLEEPDWETEL